MAKAVDLGPRTAGADEGVVARHAAVGVDAQQLAQVGMQPLRVRALEVAVAHAHHHRAVGQPGHASAEMLGGLLGWLRGEDRCHVEQLRAIKTRPHHTQMVGRRRAVGVGEVNQAVVGEPRVQQQVEQASLALRHHRWHAWHGRAAQGQLALGAGLDDAQAPRPFCDQQSPVGQEGQRPRVDEAGGHRVHPILGGPRRPRAEHGHQQDDQCVIHHHGSMKHRRPT